MTETPPVRLYLGESRIEAAGRFDGPTRIELTFLAWRDERGMKGVVDPGMALPHQVRNALGDWLVEYDRQHMPFLEDGPVVMARDENAPDGYVDVELRKMAAHRLADGLWDALDVMRQCHNDDAAQDIIDGLVSE